MENNFDFYEEETFVGLNVLPTFLHVNLSQSISADSLIQFYAFGWHLEMNLIMWIVLVL